MKYKTILWDLDGTLLDTLDDLTDSVNAALAASGFPTHSRDAVRSFVGNGMRKLIERAVPAGTGEAEQAAVREFFRVHYAAHCSDKTKPYASIPELLAKLREAGVKMAIVSNKPDFATKELAAVYFGGLTDAAIGGRDGVPVKPAREMVELALAELGTDAADAVYIGDSDVDVITAANAEMDGISVAWGFRGEDVLRAAGAKNIAHTPAELQAMLLA